MTKRIVLAFLLVAPLSAQAIPKMTIVAQRSTPQGIEQTSLSIGDSEAQLVRNANFLEGPESSVTLGLFTAQVTPALAAERALLATDLLHVDAARAAQKKLAAEDPTSPEALHESPHEVRWLLNGRELSPGSAYLRGAHSALAKGARLVNWKPKDAVRVFLGAKGRLMVERLPTGTPSEVPADCVDRVSIDGARLGLLCKVPRYGLAYLKK